MKNSNNRLSAGTGIRVGDVIEIDKSLIEYIDLLYHILGIDIDYEKFKYMSISEKQTFVRDIKIKKLLNNDIP